MAKAKLLPNRRQVLGGGLAVAAATTAASAMAFTSLRAGGAPDASLIAAWDRRESAHNLMSANDWIDCSTDGERHCWDIIDAAEMHIMQATAKTPAGAEIQAWVALDHSTTDRSESAASRRRDLAFFEAMGNDLDYHLALIIGIIRSLRAMQRMGDA